MKKYFILILSLFIVMTACNPDLLEVENLNDPDRERALANPSDLAELLKSGMLDGWYAYNYIYGIHLGMYADQNTSTNRSYNFWHITQEPRERFNNIRTEGSRRMAEDPWNWFNSAVFSSNQVLAFIETDGGKIVVDGVDRTDDCRAAAYFLKGMSQAYIGVIFDQGYIVELDTDLGSLDFSSYIEMMDHGIANMETAKSLANSAKDFKFDFIPNWDLDATKFNEYINTLAARILASRARDEAEANALGNAYWKKVEDYAAAGFKEDFIQEASNDWWSGLIYFGTFLLSNGASYNQTDIKLMHLADKTGTYPDYYPLDGSIILDPVETDDARFHDYYTYATVNGQPVFGYLNPSRNRGLFSNYRTVRWWIDNRYDEPGVPVPVVLYAEIQLLMAEAKLMQGDAAGAATLINQSPRVTKGGLPNVASTAAAVVDALHYEYSIELDQAAGSPAQWAFMRRHDLLIQGSPTQLPIPAAELEDTAKELYTFGGKEFAGEKGKFGETATASGAKGWKASE